MVLGYHVDKIMSSCMYYCEQLVLTKQTVKRPSDLEIGNGSPGYSRSVYFSKFSRK